MYLSLFNISDIISSETPMDPYYYLIMLCVMIFLGLFLGKLAEKIGVPAVTGYLIAGVLMGPVFGLVDDIVMDGLEIISNIAIGFIAFSIGMELWLPKYKKSSKQILIITIVQALLTTLTVLISVYIFKADLALALMLGAIACATAPAPIMMIVKTYKCKGEVTDTLLPVVGLDDGAGIIIFGICLSLSKAIQSGNDINFADALLTPLIELSLSIVLGAIIGFILGILSNKVIKNFTKHDRNDTYLTITLISVFISVIASHYFGLSSILVPMSIGIVLTNMIDKESFKTQTRVIDKFTPPLMIAFFTLAGAELNFNILLSAGIVGIIYVIARIIGKYMGAYLGAVLSKSSKNVRNYLGITLLPQGGVAISMVISAAAELGELGATIQTIVLAGIFFYELFGPILVKLTLSKIGESHVNETYLETQPNQNNDDKTLVENK